MKTLLSVLLVLSILLPASQPTLIATCHSLTLIYMPESGFAPQLFTARAIVNEVSLPLVYLGVDGKGYHTWAARIAAPQDLRAQGILQHRVLDYVMLTQMVKLECRRALRR